MKRISAGTRRLALVLTMAVTAVSLVQAGEFAVSSRAEYKIKKSELQAVQHLARATFGYTYNPDAPINSDVELLAQRIRQIGHRRALAEWIDDQANVNVTPMTKHEGQFDATLPNSVLGMMFKDGYSTPYADRPSGAYNRTDYREFAWWHAALNAPDQLRQRVAFALMQIVVINDDANIFNSNAVDESGLPRYTGVCHYYDNLIEKAFGDYRDILGDVAYHPVMGIFLTHKDNRKPSADGLLLPDENFAREILQLFTMGEYRTDIEGVLVRDRAGNLIRNYSTGEDIKSLARVFTGMRYAANRTNLHDPMQIISTNDHDFDEKVFPNLGLTLPARTPSAAEANNEINEAIDHIFSHPNVGPYIARILIQRLVKSNPSTTYIRDVATVFNDNGAGQRGNLMDVVKAILLHREALRSQRYRRIRSGGSTTGLRVTTKGTEHCKLVEPLVRYTQFIKMFNGQPINPTQGLRVRPNSLDLSQLPYQAPSVFNYFRPDYQPPRYEDYVTSRRIPNGELYSPEAQIYTPVFANRFQNVMYEHVVNRYSSGGNYNRLNFFNNGALAVEEGLAAQGFGENPKNVSALLEHLDLMMCHGSLSEDSKTTINNVLISSGNTDTSQLARLAIYGVFSTPESAIDE